MQLKPDELLTFQTLRQNTTSLLTENEKVNKFITDCKDEFSKQNPLR